MVGGDHSRILGTMVGPPGTTVEPTGTMVEPPGTTVEPLGATVRPGNHGRASGSKVVTADHSVK